jgi:hypothetical protein
MASVIKVDSIQTDTGNIAFSTVASERLRIDNNGNVGIGTSSPAGKLQVIGNTLSSNFYNGSGTTSAGAFGADSGGTGASITMYGSAGANPGALLLSAGSSERMRIDSSGNVGIGTVSPSTYGKFAVVSSTAGAAKISIQDTSGGSASPLLQFGVNDTSGFNTSDASRIWTTAASSTVASLNFAAYNGGAPSTAQMTLTGGNVGIGIATPVNKLDVTGVSGTNGDARGLITVTDTSTFALGVGGGITFRAKYNTAGAYIDAGNIKGIKENATDGNTGSVLAFSTQANGGSPTERMRLDSSGNLLVGTTSLFTGAYAVNIMGAAGNRAYLGMKRETASTSGVCGSLQSFNGTNAIASIDFQSNGANNSGFIQTYTWSAGSSVQGPYVTTGGTSWTTASDETLKDIIAPIEEATSKLSGLRTVFGKYKTDHDDVRRIFLIAQDVQTVLPEAVSIDGNGKLGLNYQDLVPVLVKAIQEQQTLITALTARIEALDNK